MNRHHFRHVGEMQVTCVRGCWLEEGGDDILLILHWLLRRFWANAEGPQKQMTMKGMFKKAGEGWSDEASRCLEDCEMGSVTKRRTGFRALSCDEALSRSTKRADARQGSCVGCSCERRTVVVATFEALKFVSRNAPCAVIAVRP